MTKKITDNTISNKVSSLAKMFNPSNEKKANKNASFLIIEAALNLVYGENKPWCNKIVWDNQEIDSMAAIIGDIKPKDSTEVLLVSQFIALHLKGMKIIQNDSYRDVGHGLTMIRLSHQALETLQKYRGKGQNINVNYNVLNQSGAVLNTMPQTRGSSKKGV